MTADTILVLTSPRDTTADLVVTALTERGAPVFRCDTAEFLDLLNVGAVLVDGGTNWSGRLRTPHRSVELEQIRCGYYRRPSAFAPDHSFDAATRDWISLQARLGFGGVLAAAVRWLNHPSRIGYAEYKPVQLTAAARAGLTVPPTLITNDPATAERFARDVGELIYKPLSTQGTPGTAVYTNRISAAQLADSAIGHTAHLFQQWVNKQYEVRLIVVDEQYLATAITAGSDAARVDWRTDYAALSYHIVSTPMRVREGVARLLRDLDLRFAAADFAVTKGGEWVFLDLNPNGQWAWIAKHTGLDIAGTIADALLATPTAAPESPVS
ncbi:MAG: ATP-grasp ribosomal peptide maturase [Mycobacteriales bacterium]